MKYLRLFFVFLLFPSILSAQGHAYRLSLSNPAFHQLEEKVTTPTVSPDLDTLHFYWKFGQSNMVGREQVIDIPANLSFVQLSIDSAFITDGNPYTISPKSYVAGSTSFGQAGDFGPELSLLDTINKQLPDHRIYVLKTAVGGTALADYWLNGDGAIGLAQQWRRFQDWARMERKVLVCDAFIMMQGENDAVDTSFAVNYGVNLATLIDTIRSYTDQPNLPIIIGEVNGINDPIMTYRYSVRQGQYAVARYELSELGVVTENSFSRDHTYLVDTDTYTFLDVVHYDAVSTIQFGWDIYRALQVAGLFPNNN